MGMPNIQISFDVLASTAITRSERGIVCLIIKDTVNGVFTYTKFSKVTQTYSTKNLALIKQAFADGVYKLVVCSVAESATISDALDLIKNVKFNYLVCPFAVTADNTTIATWITDMRNNKKRFKAVLVNHVANSEAIINFTTDGIYVNDVAVTSEDFAVRIAVVLATTPLNQSATYHVFDDVTAINSKADEDASIDAGELILTNDGEKIKIARAVNSLTTIGIGKKASMKKIKIIDGMDLLFEDIFNTFRDTYIGKIDNQYDNKMLLVSEINNYLDDMGKAGVLNKYATNEVDIDVEAVANYLETVLLINTDDMKEQEIREHDTDSKVLLKGNVQFLDAMEDLELNLFM